MVKRNPRRVVRRKARRTKIAGAAKQFVALEKRIKRIEEFLEPDLTTFHEKHHLAQIDVESAA